jgi:broad specificity phosphatase PhoE
MKTVYFVRHGESEGNTGRVLQGLAAPLSPEGMRQAAVIAERAAHIAFDAIISSTAQRVQQTAALIAQKTGKTVESSPLFMERFRPSSISDIPITSEITATNARWHETFFTLGQRVEDGENFDDLKTRVCEALTFLERRPEDALMVVTHGYFLRMMMTRVLCGPEFDPPTFKKVDAGFRMQNAGITVLRYDPDATITSPWYIWIWNDHAHLGE